MQVILLPPCAEDQLDDPRCGNLLFGELYENKMPLLQDFTNELGANISSNPNAVKRERLRYGVYAKLRRKSGPGDWFVGMITPQPCSPEEFGTTSVHPCGRRQTRPRWSGHQLRKDGSWRTLATEVHGGAHTGA